MKRDLNTIKGKQETGSEGEEKDRRRKVKEKEKMSSEVKKKCLPINFQSSADCHDAQLSLRDVMTVTGSGDRLINGQNDLRLYKPATLYIINPAVIAHTPALSRLQHSAQSSQQNVFMSFQNPFAMYRHSAV